MFPWEISSGYFIFFLIKLNNFHNFLHLIFPPVFFLVQRNPQLPPKAFFDVYAAGPSGSVQGTRFGNHLKVTLQVTPSGNPFRQPLQATLAGGPVQMALFRRSRSA